MSPPERLKQLLIHSKLERPRLTAGVLARPTLFEQLDEWREFRVTLISVPAGYGKSTLVAQYLESERAPPSAWLSLDSLDSDLGRFLRYFISAIREVVPDSLTLSERLLFLQDLPPPQQLAESVVAELESIEQEILLVLDDYHLVKGSEVHEWVESLVHRLPRRFHVMILTRSDPPLPLSLWRGRRWMGELRLNELRFSLEETAALLEPNVEHPVNDEHVASLHGKTEGWITGLQLFLVSLAGSENTEKQIKAFSASHRLITDYLMEEVLAGQPAEILQYIEMTSALERFSPQLTDVLLAEHYPPLAGQSQEIIDRLFKANLFLVPVGQSTDWYRYHHLFRDLLQYRFESHVESGTKDRILASAANWFLREGHFPDALNCLLSAGDLDSASDIIGDQMHNLMTGDPTRRTLRRWLERFPVALEEMQIPVLVAWGYIRKANTDVEGVNRILERIDAICPELDSDQNQECCAQFKNDIRFLRCFTAFWGGDIETARENARLLPDLEDRSQDLISALWCVYKLASLGLARDPTEYRRTLKRILSDTAQSAIDSQWPIHFARASVCLFLGDLAKCQDYASRLIVDENFAAQGYCNSVGHLLLGQVAYERNELEEATRHYEAVTALRYEGPGLSYWNAATTMARIELACGRIESARKYASEAREFATQLESARMIRRSAAVERRIALIDEGSSEFEERPATYSDLTTLAVFPASHEWALSQIQSSSANRQRSALEFIDAALKRAQAHAIRRRTIQLRALRALALDALDRGHEAVPELKAALRLGAEHGFIRSFVDLGEAILPLLQAVNEQKGDDGHAAVIIDALNAEGEPGRGEKALPAANPSSTDVQQALVNDSENRDGNTADDQLTNRELDVLELLRDRLSNKEIAARLFISPTTVKMHTLNIYSKLGVHGRRKAVAAAIERGILSP